MDFPNTLITQCHKKQRLITFRLPPSAHSTQLDVIVVHFSPRKSSVSSKRGSRRRSQILASASLNSPWLKELCSS